MTASPSAQGKCNIPYQNGSWPYLLALVRYDHLQPVLHICLLGQLARIGSSAMMNGSIQGHQVFHKVIALMYHIDRTIHWIMSHQ
jgi:hypothetical protein